MRVALVTAFPETPDKPTGGVEAVSVNLVRALSQMSDLDVQVVTTHRSRDSRAEDTWGAATIHRLPWAGGSMLRHATGPGRRQFQQYIDKLQPDLIHAHDTFGLLVKGMTIPRVFTIHGFIHGDTLISGQRFARLRAWLWRRVETAGWADQPHIVSISPYVRERLTGIATGVIHDIDNPISEEFFHVDRQERPGTIFSAGLICPRKNPHRLVEALDRLVNEGVDARLRLAGSTSHPSYGGQLEALISQRGLDDRVVLLGKISVQQIREELARASVFALVSLEENSPMGIEEAMAVGVPVVTSNRCGMPYMVQHGRSGFLVDPGDAADIADHLKRVLTDNDLRAALGTRCISVATERFHPDAVASRTREVYARAARQ